MNFHCSEKILLDCVRATNRCPEGPRGPPGEQGTDGGRTLAL